MLVNVENLSFFQALASESRLKIIEELSEGDKNIKELASILNLSSAIVTRHITTLEEEGIVKSSSIPGIRGMQKICSLVKTKEEFIFGGEIRRKNNNIETFTIDVGCYVDYEAEPTCGLATKDALVGPFDDPRYFSHPDKFKAALVWFQSGWLEYIIPSYLIESSINNIKISMEICSEYPIYKEDFKSDIFFEINGINLGKWISPGKPGDKRGRYTPNWWHSGAEYGYLITLNISNLGSYINDEKTSNVTVLDLLNKRKKDLRLKIISPRDTENPGGLNIFGKGFGNYNQGIEVKIEYK